MNVKRISNTPWIVIVAAVVLGSAVERLPDDVFMPLFCEIPARFAAFYYGAPLAMSELVFTAHGIAVTVTRACGGSGFFALCAALLFTRVWQGGNFTTSRGWLRAMAALICAVAASWFVAIAVNAMRIIFIVPVTVVARLLPDAFRAGIHMVAGMVVFMSAFTLLWFLTEYWIKQRSIYEQTAQRLCRT